MTPQNQLTVEGNFHAHPFAELVVEIAGADLTGSLRVSHNDRKCVVYFNDGRIVFAVSNARNSRLYEMMLQRKAVSKEDLAQIPNFANDLEFADALEARGVLTTETRNKLFVDQIEAILVDILSWPAGDWAFSSLTRLRSGLVFNINSQKLLIGYGRVLPVGAVAGRLRDPDEAFARVHDVIADFDLDLDEIKVLSNFADQQITTRELLGRANEPEAVLKAIYVLWLAGLLERKDWDPAFTETSIAAMRGAKLQLKKEAAFHPSKTTARSVEDAPNQQAADKKFDEVPITLDEYLERVENAETFYEVLGVDAKADIAVIKRAYFSLAKVFHPDHYHKDGGAVQKRVQNAFTTLAQAYETLKNADLRQNYDFKVRVESAEKEKQKATGTNDERSRQMQQANQSFERGLSLLRDDEVDAALPFLARAVHFDPTNARYHAYFGKALSEDDNQRHKAEAELQAALRLDPQDPTFRIMLAEFFMKMNLLKRAEGELNRLLAIAPTNRDALDLLASLQR